MLKYPLIRVDIGVEELNAIRKVFESGWLVQGPYVSEFEKAIAQYVNAKFGVAVSSCTAALYICLKALGIRQGDEVIVPDFTFPATGNVVLEIGAKPVLVDVREDSFSLDINKLKDAVTSRTRAIIVVHPFGHSASDMDAILEFAQEKGLYLIEDAATALGSTYNSKYAGTIGELGCYSFHARKLVTTGEGGMIVSNNEEYLEKLYTMRDHGRNRFNKFESHSLNFRMSDIQAAIGLEQLKKLERNIEERRKLAEIYNKLIADLLWYVTPLKERPGCRSTYQSYVIRLPESFKNYQKYIINLMKEKYGIEVQIGTYALHLEPAFRFSAVYGSLSVSEILRYTTLTLPLYRGLDTDDLEYIVQKLSDVLRSILNKYLNL